ncbi:MAG: hypothetical protein AAFX79_04980 [Planctomycetota bacterium]
MATTGTRPVCDLPISELPSASASVVVSLSRKGIVTIGDLLAADFDEVAYQLDSFDDAEVLVKEAQAMADGTQGEDAQPESQQDGNADGAADETTPEQSTPNQSKSNGPTSQQRATEPKPTAGQVGLATAMQAVLSLDGGAFASMQASGAAAQRLAAAALIIQHGGGEDEAVAAGLLDTIDPKAPCVDREDAQVRFGEPAVDLLERAELLLTVPMSPSGKPSNVHAKLVEVADASALLVASSGAVAAGRAVLSRHQTVGDAVWSLFQGGREFALWYFGSIAKGLGPALKRAGHDALAHELWSVIRALEAAGGEERKAA